MLTALHQNCLDVQMINYKTLGLVLCHMLESNQPRLPEVHQYSRCNIKLQRLLQYQLISQLCP